MRYISPGDLKTICGSNEVQSHLVSASLLELDGALGGDPSSKILKRGGLHLVVTEVVPVGGSADNKQKKSSCVVMYLSEGLRRSGV